MEPAADVAARGVHLDQRHAGRHGAAVAGGALVQAGAEDDDAIGLVDQAAPGRVRERADQPQVVGPAAEHVLGLQRGGDHGAHLVGQLLDGRACPGLVGAQADHEQRLAAAVQQRGGGVHRHLPGAQARRGGRRRRSGCIGRGAGDQAELHVHRQQQGGAATGLGRRYSQGQAAPGGGGFSRDKGLDARGLQHRRGIQGLAIGAQAIGGAGAGGPMAKDQQQPRAGAVGIHRSVQAIGRGRAAADDGDAQPAGGRRIALGHGHRLVLVAGAVKAHAHRV